jgi:hypothetical protein
MSARSDDRGYEAGGAPTWVGADCRVWLLTVKDDDVADAEDQLAAGALDKVGNEHFFLVLEVVELDLDELMMVQGGLEGGVKRVGEAGFADSKDWCEALGARPEEIQLRSGRHSIEGDAAFVRRSQDHEVRLHIMEPVGADFSYFVIGAAKSSAGVESLVRPKLATVLPPICGLRERFPWRFRKGRVWGTATGERPG